MSDKDEATRGTHDWWKAHDTVLPFGHYAGGDGLPPHEGSIVGRETARAFVQIFLRRMSRRGGVLVTGHRGAGKTTFVNRCVDEYESDIFERTLYTNVGRSLFWDRLVLLAVAITGIVAALFSSEVLELAIELIRGQGGSGDAQSWPGARWILAIPFAGVCAYPIAYGIQLSRVLRLSDRDGPSGLHGGGGAFVVLGISIGVLLLGVFLPPFGAPALAAASMFLFLACIVFIGESAARPDPGGPTPRRITWRSLRGMAAPLAPGLFLVEGGIRVREYWSGPQPVAAGSSGNEDFAILLALALLVLAAGDAIRMQDRRHVSRPASGHPPDHGAAELAAQSATATRYGFTALAEVGAALVVGVVAQLGWSTASPLVLAGVAALAIVTVGRMLHPVPPGATPNLPRAVLGAKAVLAALLAVQLLEPLLAAVTRGVLRITDGVDKWAARQLTAALQGGAGSRPDKESLMGMQSLVHRASEGVSIPAGPEEFVWIAVCLAILVLLYHTEHEWIVRPFAAVRREPALCADGADLDTALDANRPAYRWVHRRFAEHTLAYAMHRHLTPLLRVHVNLGFEDLDHRRVIQAMLVGLGSAYRRAFLSPRSPVGLIRLAGIVIFLLLTTRALGESLFGFAHHSDSAEPVRKIAAGTYCPPTDEDTGLPTAEMPPAHLASAMCSLGLGGTLPLLYLDLLRDLKLQHAGTGGSDEESAPDSVVSRSNDLLCAVLPCESTGEQPGKHLRVYHLLVLGGLGILMAWLAPKLALLPYRPVAERLDEARERLSTRQRVEQGPGIWNPVRWLQAASGGRDLHQLERDPEHPRSVEIEFLAILEDMSQDRMALPGLADHRLSLPAPEVIFIFDELDKIGVRGDPSAGTPAPEEDPVRDDERARSLRVHKLLADMKHLLSSAQARFFFVGGRNLHDEWLADETARQPLLTNIFNAEVYLPSLLVDTPGGTGGWEARVEDYLAAQHRAAVDLFGRMVRWRATTAFGREVIWRQPPAFAGQPSATPGRRATTDIAAWSTDRTTELDEQQRARIVQELVRFLAHRSAGNPKAMRELLEKLLVPVGEIDDAAAGLAAELQARADHVIRLREGARYRIALVAELFRGLEVGFGNRLTRQDDKLVVSLFYLSDFLLKFHGRGFSWTNIDRVDELVHIHRAPDHRKVMEELVDLWSDRYLHPILNGLYDFRFRSDVTREIAYVSHESEQEMAAFNFTLDESQALKRLYETNLHRMGADVTPEALAALGDLHEFDRDYDVARHYYSRARLLLDDRFNRAVGDGDGATCAAAATEPPAVYRALGGGPEDREILRRYLSWGVSRLRLTLQIGMSYELAHNYEMAGLEYRGARLLARSLVRAWTSCAVQEGPTLVQPPEFHHVDLLKQLTVIFQPALAEAWIHEKLVGGVDTSTTIVEQYLHRLRRVLPFVSSQEAEPTHPKDPTLGILHSNIALAMAELHNKAGDLYFFKGSQPPPPRPDPPKLDPDAESRGGVGYSLRAHHHYAVGLHELRRYASHRLQTLSTRLEIHADAGGPLRPAGWSDFVWRAAGRALTDMAEGALARVQSRGAHAQLTSRHPNPVGEDQWDFDTDAQRLEQGVIAWIDGGPGDEKLDLACLPTFRLDDWFGRWTGHHKPDAPGPDLAFGNASGNADRLLVGLLLRAVGARFLEQAGYLEDAAREMLGLSHIATSVGSWQRARPNDPESPHLRLFDVALTSLQRARSLFARSRSGRGLGGVTRVAEAEEPGVGYPIDLIVAACGARLVFDPDEKRTTAWHAFIDPLVEGWGLGAADARTLLGHAWKRNPYPMVTRLRALKLEVDASCRSADGAAPAPGCREPAAATLRLIELADRFDSPMHFTHLELGVTLAAVWRRLDRAHQLAGAGAETDAAAAAEREAIYRAARHHLRSCEEIVTMKRRYYDVIQRLYYLYDDFNDRQIHTNHALQMAALDVVRELRTELEEADPLRRSTPLPTPTDPPAGSGGVAGGSPPAPRTGS